MMKRYAIPNIHPAGWPFIGAFAVVTVLLALIAKPLGWIGLIATAWCVYFFRDPERTTPEGNDLVISPADGVVQAVGRAVPPKELAEELTKELGGDGTPTTRGSIFLDVLDVHVNRQTRGGVVTQVSYRPGKFFNAALDKASEFNERTAISMRTKSGHDLAFVQIAGLVARRIVCNLKADQEVFAGERFGIIRFGSRVDVYLPDSFRVLAREGQRMIGGESLIAQLRPAGERGLGPE